MPVYLVDTVVVFRHKYLVEAKEPGHACDEVCMNDGNLVELTQRGLGETISDVREVSQEDINVLIEQLKVDKYESCPHWLTLDKLINKIDYKNS